MRGLLCWMIVGCVVFATTPGHASPGMATGFKIGEMDHDSAIIWTRLTRDAERVTDGPTFQKGPKNHVNPPIDDPHTFIGAAPGAAGETRAGWRVDQPNARDANWSWTDWGAVDIARDFTRQVALRDLKPGASYQLVVEGRAPGGDEAIVRVEGEFRTAPAPDDARDVSFVVVTGQEYQRRDDPLNGHKIYPRMLALQPDFFVHTGDIIYYDKERPWAPTVELARLKWNRMYALPYQREFHTRVGSYFIKDDHDTLKNDCWPGQKYGDIDWETGLALYREQVPMGERTYRTRRWGRDLQVWMVEGRDFRSPNTAPDGPEKTIWGEAQRRWLFDSIEGSDATFRVLISPTPIVGPDRKNKRDNHANEGFAHAGQVVREFLASQRDLYVVCGDRHWQYESVDPATGLREFSCGPTSDVHAGGFSESQRSEMHQYLKVKGGFLQVGVRRPNDQPQIYFRHYGVAGQVYHESSIAPTRN